MDSRDYYKMSYGNRNESNPTTLHSHDILDNETEFNANQFKLFDDFTTDLRISYNPLRNHYHAITRVDSRRRADPNDSGVDMENGNPIDDVTMSNDVDLLENEVMVDPWSSMDSSNSPLTDSVPSASEDCTPSTSSDAPSGAPLSADARRVPNPIDAKPSNYNPQKTDRARSRDLTLDLDNLETDSRRTHFLDDDFQSSSKSNIECRIPKPHFLDHSPSPDEFDERSDITNPNFLDDEVDGDDGQTQKKAGALPKRPQKPSTSTYSPHSERPQRSKYRTTLHYGLESAARASERDKRASQLYRGTWPGERDLWPAQDASSVRSFSSNGSADGTRPSSNLENKMECVCSLISLLSLSPENNADLSGPLLDMSRSVESCVAMRQAGCIPLLVQLIHSKVARETRDRAAKALRNIIHTQTDDKAGRREARVWRLLEQVREYCYILEDLVEARKEGREAVEDDAAKHPSQSVAALMKLSFDEEHRHVVCQLGGLQALAALVRGDQAAHGARTLDATCLTMRKYAGMTLTNLTFGDGNNKSLLCSFKDFMLALVEQLESPNDDMRQVTAAVLRNLSWRADTNSKLVLREVGAVKGLTKAAMTCQKEATLKSVLSALWNLTAHCSMNKVALCSVDGALGFLVDMLSYNSPTKTLAIVENAGGIMRNVSSHIAVREDYRQILRERNCLSVLLQHLKSPSLTVVSNSCGTLWNLSARCALDQQFLWERGAVPMLRSLIHSKHKMIAMGSGAALKNLLNSKPGKTHIVSLDATARSMNLPALPTLGARKQAALEHELDHDLPDTCDNIEPATSPATTNREEKNLFTATERQLAMNLERHRMTSSSPLMGTLTSQISLSHSAHLASYLSCSNTLLKGALVSRSTTGGSAGNVNRSDSKDSVTSTHSDSVFERVMRTGKVPVPTPRNKDLMKSESSSEAYKTSKQMSKDGTYLRYPVQPPVPPPRSTELRTNYTESGFDVDQDSCDQPIDYSRKYSETKTAEAEVEKPKAEGKKYGKKESSTYGDYQETDLDQPTDYSLRYAEHQSETGSDSEPPGPSVHEDTIQHFATEGTPYETPIIFSTATSMSDLRIIGKDGKPKTVSSVKENPEVMTHSDEKDTCSIEDSPNHDNDLAATTPQSASVTENSRDKEKPGVFDTKFSSGMFSPEKPVSYCDEGTPGYFSRVSSLSSLGEPAEGDLAKRNAMATIHVEPGPPDHAASTAKDKEGSKAVTFATAPSPPALTAGSQAPSAPGSGGATPASKYVQETPLMFSRSSSLGSLPDCGDQHDDQGSVQSEVSRLTSGCISPSEIPDSPGAPASPRAPSHRAFTAPSSPPQGEEECGVFSERVRSFGVEHTPAQFSRATSLSSLTIGSEPKLHKEPLPKVPRDQQDDSAPQMADDVQNAHILENRDAVRPVGISTPMRRDPIKEPATPSEQCRVYVTEDTPALLSTAGSASDLSALSLESARRPERDSSDSSGLSDAGDLLEECIQKGIAKVVKNKGPPSETSSVNHYRDDVYRSLPPYLRSSTETVKMSHDLQRNVRDSCSGSSRGSPAPPLPPRPAPLQAPPRPPHSDMHYTEGRKLDSRLPVKCRSSRDRQQTFTRTDSLSSLSVESFGSTDREIFEETVQAGLSTHTRRPDEADKSRSVERPAEFSRHARHHRSLDRSDKIPHQRTKVRDPEFERNLALGAYNLKSSSKMKKLEELSRSPLSYGEIGPVSHQSRFSRRHYEDGPPSLPARIDERRLDRSNSLSSLSNDSFGSTDKEVFERCVRMGMSKPPPKKKEDKRVRSDDRLEVRSHRRRRREGREGRGALDKMGGEDSRERALLEEVIAKGAGEHKQSKNVPEPSAEAAAAGALAHTAPPGTGCDAPAACDVTVQLTEPDVFDKSNELPTVDSLNTTLESADETDMQRSNECLAPASANTTIESEKDELNRSNESYADVFNESWSEPGSPPRPGAAPRHKLEWTDIKCGDKPPDDTSKKEDTWNDNTCPDDVTFPTISGSVHMVSSIRSEVVDPGMALPDLLEKSEAPSMSFSRPDLTNKLETDLISRDLQIIESTDRIMLDSIPEPSFTSLIDDQRFDSILSEEIEKEAARLAAQLKISAQYNMENSVTSLTSLDLENVKPPSNLGSLLSLSASGQWDETSQMSKKSQRSRKKSLPVALMVKRALSNSMHQGSTEHLDSTPVSFLENIKPPSEMEHLDMESSMVSVSSIVSEVAEARDKAPVVFDFKQPVQDFPLCNTFTHVFHDLDKVNPPSLFDEMVESTLELEPSTAQRALDDCASTTLHVVTDIPSGSENCTPLPSDVSSVESTPKKQRDPNYLTPKEKRQFFQDRYQTYTITDTVTENDVVLEVDEEFLTWTKSDSLGKSEEYVTAASEIKSRRKVSAKQRRLEDRARYQTQTVELPGALAPAAADPAIESLKQRLAAKKTIKQKRIEDAERFRTRTLSEDIPPSPTFVTKDANFENVETTTGYDSLSSNEPTHQQLDAHTSDERHDDDVFSRDADSGHNEDDCELNSSRMQTYTRSFRNYLPVTESPAAVDLCVLNNLKNIEMTASYRRALPHKNQNPSSGDFASYEGDSNSEDKLHSESDTESPRPKPKIIKPARRDDSLDSNDSLEKEPEAPKAIRGRKKAMYVSPYRRSAPAPKKPAAPVKPAPKSAPPQPKPLTSIKAQSSAKASKAPLAKAPSANTSPKKSLPHRSPSKIAQKPGIPPTAKPLPLERQGTFTKEESSVPAIELPVPDKKAGPRLSKSAPQTKANTSPSRLPQYSRSARPATAGPSKSPSKAGRKPEPAMKSSPSTHSLQSTDSGRTVTIASRGSRQGSTSSVNSIQSTSRASAKDVESKISTLWKKVERAKKQPPKVDKRVWIESDKTEPPRLIRSSTFEGQPRSQAPAAKQKSAIGLRASQIPAPRPKQPAPAKKPAPARQLARKPPGAQLT